MTNLRDHDRTCGHSGAYHAVDLRSRSVDSERLHWECRQWDCPGGAAFDVDIEAARRELIAWANEIEGTARHSAEAVHDIVGAAFGSADPNSSVG